MILLALGVLVALLALRSTSSAEGSVRPAAPALALLGYLLPALLLAAVLYLHRDDATRFRFALLGYGFRSEDGRNLPVDVGGDRDRSDVWVSALREEGGGAAVGRLVFRPARTEGGTPSLQLEIPRGTEAGFFAHRRPKEPLTPFGTVELQQGDRITVAGRTWEVRFDTGPFGPPARFMDGEGNTVDLPPRRSRLPLVEVELPVGRPLAASQETYPLAFLEKAATGTRPSPLPRAFLFHQPGVFVGSSLRLAAPDGSASVERGGQPLEILQTYPIAPGDALHVLSYPKWNDESEFAAGGVRDRRSFRVDIGQSGFTLELDTKEIHALPWRRATAADRRIGVEDVAMPDPPSPDGKPVSGPTPGKTPLRVSLAMSDWQFVDRSLHFTHASQKVAGEALAMLELPRDPGDDEDGLTASTPRGQSHSPFGQPIWLGDDRLAAVQLDVLRPPVLLGLLAIALALLKATAARSTRLTGAELAFAAALEGLVTLRVLLGYRAWAMPPFSDEAFRLAMIAWALLPWSFLAATLPRARLRGQDGEGRFLLDSLPVYGGLLFAAVWCARFSGGGARAAVWVLCLAGLGLLPFLRTFGHLLTATGRWLATAVRRLIRRPRRAARAKGPDRFGGTLPWIGLALIPGAVRLLLFFAGAKESLPLANQRFALTLLHVPLAIVLQAAYLAWLWRRAEPRGRIEKIDLAPALAFLLGTWLAPAVLVSDLGLALLNVPVFLFALCLLCLAVVRRAREAGDTGARLWGPPALVAGALAGLLLITASPAGARLFAGVLTLVSSEEKVERNYLRVLAFAYPEQLGLIARRSSEEVAIMNAVMASYTSRPHEQCRYFTSELSPHLRTTTLREHAPAVLLAAEWGVAGMIGALLLYLAVAQAGLGLAPWRLEENWEEPGSVWRSSAFQRSVALLAGLTFALPSVYMILANYRLTLFTGKNAYLLGLDSNADVLESLVLTALFAAAAAAVRDPEDLS